jgi:hypothetical protein
MQSLLIKDFLNVKLKVNGHDEGKHDMGNKQNNTVKK